MDLLAKLEILADAAKYDVACTSSGIDRDAQKGKLGNTLAAGCCHSFAADGRCITLLKVLMTNVCVYDCAYCVNRASNEVPRAAFSQESWRISPCRFIDATILKACFSARELSAIPTTPPSL